MSILKGCPAKGDPGEVHRLDIRVRPPSYVTPGGRWRDVPGPTYLKLAVAGYVLFLVANLLLSSLLVPTGTRGSPLANLVTITALATGVVFPGRMFALRSRSQWIVGAVSVLAFAVGVTQVFLLVARFVVP